MNNPLDYQYCDRHDVVYNKECEQCKGEYEDFLHDCHKEDNYE